MAQLISFLIYFSILISLLKASLAANYIDSKCSNTTKFGNNSKYQTNLNTLFHYLASNATNRYDYNATAGVGTNNVVYGHFLCRGDQSNNSCQDCVKEATTTDLPIKCPDSKVAIIWYGECMVRYSNEPFFSIFDYDTGYIRPNPQNVTGNVSQFINITNDMYGFSGEGFDGFDGFGGGAKPCTTANSFACKYNPDGVYPPSLAPQPPPTSNATDTEAGTPIISPSVSPSSVRSTSNATGTGTGTVMISPSSTPSRNSGNDKRLKIILIVIAVSGIAILAAIVYFLCRRKARKGCQFNSFFLFTFFYSLLDQRETNDLDTIEEWLM